MNIIRKALLPTGIAFAFLLFLGAVGGVQTTAADQLNEGTAYGDGYVKVGESAAYWIVLTNDSDETIGAEVNGPGSIVMKLDGTGLDDLEAAFSDEIAGLDSVDYGDMWLGLLDDLWEYGFDDEIGGSGVDDELVDGDHVALVIVECDSIGEYTVSFFSSESDDTNGSVEVTCVGVPDAATITARPTTVEIAPSYANVAHSLIVVTVEDEDGESAFPGDNVVFFTDRCSIETSMVNNLDGDDVVNEYGPVAAAYAALNPLAPITARMIEEHDSSTTAPDSNRQQDEALTFGHTNGSTIAAAILHCDPIHAPGVTPGVATITAVIDVDDQNSGDDDLVVKTTVTVVGPPAATGLTVTASPASLICGEKATITVTVKDSIGQAVSDHTLVEAVTNAGGVLGGNGAVAGYGGPVTPISSTLAETFGGTATIYLLTSSAHVGKYEVLVTTGGGGGVTGQLYGHYNNFGDFYGKYIDTVNYLGGLFTTAPISAQVTVECTVPVVAPAAPAPTTTGPTTGTGIKPPSTGDAGLATSSGSSLTLIAGAAVAAFALVSAFGIKKVADKN